MMTGYEFGSYQKKLEKNGAQQHLGVRLETKSSKELKNANKVFL